MVRRLALAAAVCCGLLTLAPAAEAAFPGGNGKIAFSSNRDGDYEIYTMNGDGSGVTQLTNDPANDTDPAWSAEGTQIAFSSNRDGDYEIYTMNADGSGVTSLTNDPANDTDPAWSADGSRVAFERQSLIYLMNVDGTGETHFAGEGCGPNSCSLARGPAWSAADKIAFERFRSDFEDSGILTRNPDGSGTLVVADTVDAELEPNWSPDARTLVYTYLGFTGSERGIAKIDANRSGQMQLDSPASPIGDYDPAWSPDGTKIVFARHLGPGSAFPTPVREIFAMSADGAAMVNLTNHPADDEDPDWQPSPPRPFVRVPATYPRPIGAAKKRVTLVPAFKRCAPAGMSKPPPVADTEHGPPLDRPSCSQIQLEGARPGYSHLLEFPNDDSTRGNGSLVLRVVLGDPTTGQDEADVLITVAAQDVRCGPLDPELPPLPWGVEPPPCGPPNASGGEDYSGKLLLRAPLRITDTSNIDPYSNQPGAATVRDMALLAPVNCVPSGDSSIGSSCDVSTSADSLYGNLSVAQEDARAVWQLGRIEVLDPGRDNFIGSASECPPTCGNGDEAPFLRSGIFIP